MLAASFFHWLSVRLPGRLPARFSWLAFCLLQQPPALVSPPTSQSPNSQFLQDKNSLSSRVSRPLLPASQQCCGTGTDFPSPGPASTPGAGSASSFRWGQLHLFLDLRGQTSPRVRCSACGRGSINEGWHHCRADPPECTQSPSLGIVMGPQDNLRTHMSLDESPLTQSSTRAVGRNTQRHSAAKTWTLCYFVPQSLELPIEGA